MKKILVAIIVLIGLAGAGFLVYQNLPSKKFEKTIAKARIFVKLKDFENAKKNFQKAFEIKGAYTPYVTKEVLEIENIIALKNQDFESAINNIKMYLSKNPGKKDVQISLAQLAFQAKQVDLAFSTIQEILAVDKLYFPARFLLANLRLVQGRPDLAEKQIQILYKEFPDSTQVIIPMVETLISQGKFTESQKILIRLLENKPEFSHARILLFDAHFRNGEIERAQEVLDAWEVEDSTLAEPLALRKAQVYSTVNRLDDAMAVLKPYYIKEKGHLLVLSELAKIHVKKGEVNSALAIYEKIMDMEPKVKEPVRILTHLLYMYKKKPAKAMEVIKQVYTNDKNPEVVKFIMNNYAAIDRLHKAKEFILEQPQEVQPRINRYLDELETNQDFLALVSLISYYKLTQQNVSIHETTKKLYKQFPANPFAASLYAKQLASLNNYVKAVDVLENFKGRTLIHDGLLLGYHFKSGNSGKALSLAKSMLQKQPDIPGINGMIANFYYSINQKEKAISYFEKELAIIPDNPVVLNNLAWEYGVEQNNYEKAKPYLDKLAELKMVDAKVLDTQGWAEAKHGNFQKADSLLQMAVNLVPDNPSMLYHLGFAKINNQKKTEGVKILKNALDFKVPWHEKGDAQRLVASNQ